MGRIRQALQLLWEEYRTHCGDGAGQQTYRYSAFCEKYRTWTKRLKRSMRQIHPGGERWILARLRNRRFFSLGELNQAIAELLADLNQRPFKKLPDCRASAFTALDAPALKPLPATAVVLAQFKPARVNIDHHVAFEGHDYSVPHQRVGAAVELRVTATMLEVLLRRQRVAAHARSAKVGGFTTVAEHMPASHRAHLQWTPAKLMAWA